MFVLYTSKIIILVRAYSWHKDALKKKRKKKIKKKRKKKKKKKKKKKIVIIGEGIFQS